MTRPELSELIASHFSHGWTDAEIALKLKEPAGGMSGLLELLVGVIRDLMMDCDQEEA